MITRIESALLAAEKWGLCALLAVMISLSFLQVVLRGFFSAGLLWADTFLRHLVVWACFLGAALAAGEEKHFAFDALSRLLTGTARRAARLAVSLACAAVCAWLACASWSFFADEFRSDGALFSVASMTVPAWTFALAYPAGFILLSVHYAIKALLARAPRPNG